MAQIEFWIEIVEFGRTEQALSRPRKSEKGEGIRTPDPLLQSGPLAITAIYHRVPLCTSYYWYKKLYSQITSLRFTTVCHDVAKRLGTELGTDSDQSIWRLAMPFGGSEAVTLQSVPRVRWASKPSKPPRQGQTPNLPRSKHVKGLQHPAQWRRG
jgi:hypothetical protein